VRFAPAALLCLLAVSCVPSKRREVASPSELGSGEVLLIGRVKLTPPIDPKDQKLAGIVESWRGRVMVLISEENRPIERPIRSSDYKGRIEAPPDREFSVAVPLAWSLAIRGGIVPLSLGEQVSDEALLPGGFRVDLRENDTAVYIGTIHYKRDEFWQIQDVVVEDDYDHVKAQCLQRWGPTASLRKALVTIPAGILKKRP
jgi:hypothetical protein